jgi:hypothetical protein
MSAKENMQFQENGKGSSSGRFFYVSRIVNLREIYKRLL